MVSASSSGALSEGEGHTEKVSIVKSIPPLLKPVVAVVLVEKIDAVSAFGVGMVA